MNNFKLCLLHFCRWSRWFLVILTLNLVHFQFVDQRVTQKTQSIRNGPTTWLVYVTTTATGCVKKTRPKETLTNADFKVRYRINNLFLTTLVHFCNKNVELIQNAFFMDVKYKNNKYYVEIFLIFFNLSYWRNQNFFQQIYFFFFTHLWKMHFLLYQDFLFKKTVIIEKKKCFWEAPKNSHAFKFGRSCVK